MCSCRAVSLDFRRRLPVRPIQSPRGSLVVCAHTPQRLAMQPIRIAIADASQMFVDAIRGLLDAESDLSVVGAADCGAAAVDLVRRELPDVLLLDTALPDGTCLDVLRTLNDTRLAVRVVLLAVDIDKQEMVDAVCLGARGLVLKHSPASLLVKCVRSVIEGEYWFGHDHVPEIIDALRAQGAARATAPADTLTPREIVVMAAVADGATNRDISLQLGLSEQTVKNHISHIYDKVGVSNRVELTLFVISHKLGAGRNGSPASN